MIRRTGRFAAVITATFIVATPATAYAADSTPPPTGQAALASQYNSLSGALLNYYAQQSNKTLSQYLNSEKVLLAPTTITDPVSAQNGTPDADQTGVVDLGPTLIPANLAAQYGLTGTPITASDLTDLNKQLSADGLTLDTSKMDSLSDLASQIVAKANTADAQVTLAGAQWASSLLTMQTPKLTTPNVATPSGSALPKDALAFGLLLDKSFTDMVTNSPNLLSQMRTAGLGTPGLSQAWTNSMLQAYSQSSADLTKMVANPCVAGMLNTMATGETTTNEGSCGGCAIGGQFLHGETSGLFNPSVNTKIPNLVTPVWNPTEGEHLQPWLKDLITTQNPQVGQLLDTTNAGAAGTTTCTSAGQAATSNLTQTLPSVFANLAGK